MPNLGLAPLTAFTPPGDSYRMAGLLVAEHGDGAEIEVARRGDVALDRGDVLVSAAWGRVGRALDDLRRSKPRPGDGRA